MKTTIKIITLALSIFFFLMPNHTKSQCHIDDWTALKALYESTNGDNWINNQNWEQVTVNSLPFDCVLEDLYGVTLNEEGRVKYVILDSNGLSGHLPKELSSLVGLEFLMLIFNDLYGCYPNDLTLLCNQISSTTNDISLGNNFNVLWDDFCSTCYGACDWVWPGDFNTDGIVNDVDVLQWGLCYNSTGPPRQNTECYGYTADWNQIVNGVNCKYSDGNGNGIIDEDDLQVVSNNIGHTNHNVSSQTTDVYPGDLNHDGIVDNIDFVLKEDQNYLYNSGPSRATEHQNTDWYPHPSEDWGLLQFNGKDIKHHDCNGNGFIDESDYAVVDENWGLEWTEPVIETPPAESNYQVRIYPIDELSPNYLRMNVALENVSSGDLVLDRAYFTIKYDDLANNVKSATFNFGAFPWIGVPGINLETTVEHYPTEKEIKVGFKRKDDENSAGTGNIGELILQLSGTNNSRTNTSPCIINLQAINVGTINNASNRTLLKNQQLQVSLCEGTCQTNWYVDETQFQNEFKSTNLIETNGFLIIGEEQRVNYQSNRVCLQPGFKVKAGASFKAGYGSCN